MASAPPLPPIIAGAWQLSAGHHRSPMTEEEAYSSFDALLDLGVTAFDCADIYTGVEELLGTWVRRVGAQRGAAAAERIRIHTKLVPDRDALANLDREHVRRVLDRSRVRLGVERLALVQFAWWDYAVPGCVETATWLEELRTEGVLESIGVTNFDARRLTEILDAGVPVVSQQLQYSALDHRPSGPMTALCRSHGVAMLCYGTLAGGFLSDRWLNGVDPAPPGPRRSLTLENRSLTKYRLIIDEYGGWTAYQGLLRTMREIADRHGTTVAAVAIRYALSRPGVSSAIVGVSTPARMREALAAASLVLSVEDLDRVEQLGRASPGPRGPVFGLEREAGSDHAKIMKYNLNRGE